MRTGRRLASFGLALGGLFFLNLGAVYGDDAGPTLPTQTAADAGPQTTGQDGAAATPDAAPAGADSGKADSDGADSDGADSGNADSSDSDSGATSGSEGADAAQTGTLASITKPYSQPELASLTRDQLGLAVTDDLSLCDQSAAPEIVGLDDCAPANGATDDVEEPSNGPAGAPGDGEDSDGECDPTDPLNDEDCEPDPPAGEEDDSGHCDGQLPGDLENDGDCEVDPDDIGGEDPETGKCEFQLKDDAPRDGDCTPDADEPEGPEGPDNPNPDNPNGPNPGNPGGGDVDAGPGGDAGSQPQAEGTVPGQVAPEEGACLDSALCNAPTTETVSSPTPSTSSESTGEGLPDTGSPVGSLPISLAGIGLLTGGAALMRRRPTPGGVHRR